MIEAEPGAVVVRTGRPGLLVLLAVSGVLLAGVLTALWTSLAGRTGFLVDGKATGGAWTAVGWLVLVPLTLMLALAVVALGRQLVHQTVVVVSPSGYRLESRGQVEVSVAAADLSGVLFRPAARATWQDSDPGDPSPRGVGRTRLGNRIELQSLDATVEVFESGRWREVVDVVRGWVLERPELVDDDATRSFLLEAPVGPDHDRAVIGKPGWPLGMLRLAIRTRDPWAPFLPDSYGQYSSMFNGRHAIVRAPRRGRPVGLFLRWLFVFLWIAPVLVLLFYVIRLVLT
ncbi:MAG: hypothetical protein ACXWDM_09135 [Nocardioides sp.]